MADGEHSISTFLNQGNNSELSFLLHVANLWTDTPTLLLIDKVIIRKQHQHMGNTTQAANMLGRTNPLPKDTIALLSVAVMLEAMGTPLLTML